MSPAEVITILQAYSNWRKGGDDWPPSPNQTIKAINAAIEMIERLEAAESDALEQARLNGMGASREAALMAKLEATEKEANKINGRMVEVKKRLQLIVEEPSNTMSNAKAMREMLRQANLALNALK
jgi:DNA polymerase/3'-5' exonuclease PolX